MDDTGWAILKGAFLFLIGSIAVARGWVDSGWRAIKAGVHRILKGPEKALPDYAKIRRMEIELGMMPEPEESLLEAAEGRDGAEEIRSWGEVAPLRRIDPAPKMPDPPRPQIDRK